MNIRAGIASVLLGLALLPGGLPAEETLVTAKAPRTPMQLQLSRLIREEHGIAAKELAPAGEDAPVVTGDTFHLEPMIVTEEKLKNLPPPETKMENFIRTGTIWEKIGRKFTQRFWAKGDEGIMFTLSW